ncbi:MAG TPA: crosslink repair DNA glycosylase YcaQ family protein, partial [Minicystis sp.]|nr:crosslink repair DNA glycosylase YcaQ family protein [Minicystis sp.]
IAGEALASEGGLWHVPTSRAGAPASAHLLPPYDEYTVAYRDRSAFLDAAHAERTRNGIFSRVVLVDGRIVGTWTRVARRGSVAIDVEAFASVAPAARRALERAAHRYGAFAGAEATLAIRAAATAPRAKRARTSP